MTQNEILEFERSKLLATVAKLRLLADKLEVFARTSNDGQAIATWNTCGSLLAAYVKEKI